MKKILVTGGAGFIGSHTALSLLEKGYAVVILDSFVNSTIKVVERIKNICDKNNIVINDRLQIYEGDLRDINSIEKVFNDAINSGNSINGVLHFAGLKSVSESVNNPIKYWDMNVKSSINLFSMMEKFGCFKIVFSSSATIYGHSKKHLIDENSAVNPINPYGSSKVAIENMLDDLFINRQEKWSMVKLRYFNPIGAHYSGLIGEDTIGKPNNIFPIILNKVFEKEKLEIFGNDWPTFDGTGVRDYIHVMDLAEGHVKTLEYISEKNNQNLNINLGTGQGTSVLELIEIFGKVNNLNVMYTISDRRKGDTARVIADNKLALKLLNWYPKRSLTDMCRDGWNWKIKNPNGY